MNLAQLPAVGAPGRTTFGQRNGRLVALRYRRLLAAGHPSRRVYALGYGRVEWRPGLPDDDADQHGATCRCPACAPFARRPEGAWAALGAEADAREAWEAEKRDRARAAARRRRPRRTAA